ncbi:MAG TPA: hypothetical protein VG317_07220, partial [Pseudonocardiaceae bacterium]|nr:hypothetical protein [Pseudonocardiaceae bacterium]
FSADELQGLLGQWNQLQDSLQSAMSQTESMWTINPAATDTASDLASGTANDSGSSYLQHLAAMSEYAFAYTDALTTALKNYQAAEAAGHQSATNVQTNLSN